MAPLTQSYDAPQRAGEDVLIPMAAETKVFLGALVATNAAGHAVPASDTAGLIVWGRSQHDLNNSAGAAGDLDLVVRRGVFAYDNSTENPITQAHVGQDAYAEDDHTVASTSDNLVVAGTILAIEGDKVWIDTRTAQSRAAAVEESE